MKAPEELRRWAESLGFVLVPQHVWDAVRSRPRRVRMGTKWADEMAELKRNGAVRVPLERFDIKTTYVVRHRMQEAAYSRGMTGVLVRVVGGMVYVFYGVKTKKKETK